mgnify:CR=1 FL=1
MLVISERINQLIKGVGEAIKARDRTYVQEFAKKQIESGASCLDVHVEDAERMKWTIATIKEAMDVGICIDTTDTGVLKAALSGCDENKDKTIVNSIDLGKRLEPFLELIRAHECECVALAIDEKAGIPDSAEERLEVCKKILDAASKEGIEKDKIYFDPLVLPVSVNSENGLIALETLELLKREGMKTTIGLTNISQDLPNRGLLEAAYLVSCLRHLDAVMLNPLDKQVMSVLKAGEAVLGMDKRCRHYLRDYR